MFVRVIRGGSVQTFNLWIYGDSVLVRGSGINISPEGFACNHHFLTPKDGTVYNFLSGDHIVEIYASLAGSKSPLLLSSVNLFVSPEYASALSENKSGLFFDWA